MKCKSVDFKCTSNLNVISNSVELYNSSLDKENVIFRAYFRGYLRMSGHFET